MTETPQKYRQIVRDEVEAIKPFGSVTYSAKLMRSLVNDADRLAKLEDGIRAMADGKKLRSMIGHAPVDGDDFVSDNLALALCEYFENHADRPDDDPEDPDTGWGEWTTERTDAALATITEQCAEPLRTLLDGDKHG